MNTCTHTQLLAQFFRSNDLDAVVNLRLVDDAQASLTIWPYAVDSTAEKRNLAPASPSSRRDRPYVPQRTHVLVLPATIEIYDQSRQLIIANPVLSSNDRLTRVLIEPLSLTDMTSLFASSRVDYRVALSVVIE